VRDDDQPHLVPVWFWWDGETILVFSKPNAVKVRALRRHPRAMIALGEPDDDFDVAMIEAEAELLAVTPPVPDAFFDKYEDKLAAGRLDRETFRATYTQAIRLTPTRWLPWHGRGEHLTMRSRLAGVSSALSRVAAACQRPGWIVAGAGGR
jgi:PPOX class probable F420-dependent enzyme